MINFTVVGNLTRDAELSKLPNGDVISFTVAANRKKTNGEQEVSFIRFGYWLKNGDGLVKYLNKGTKVAVSGSWYVNKKGSNDQYYQTFYADKLELIGTRDSSTDRRDASSDNKRKSDPLEVDTDDLPF